MKKNIGFIIYNNGRYGGPEKRIARLLNWLSVNSEYHFHLCISDRMHQWIIKQNIIISTKISLTLYSDTAILNNDTLLETSQAPSTHTTFDFLKKGFVLELYLFLKALKEILKKYLFLRKWVKTNSIQIVQGWHDVGNAMVLLKWFQKTKIVYSLTDSRAYIGTPLKWISNFSFKLIFKFSDVIEMLSADIKNKYEKNGAYFKKNVSIAPSSFIDYSACFSANKLNLISFAAARFEPEKNTMLCVEAANILINEMHQAVSFCIMGGMLEENNIKQKIQEYNLSKSIDIIYSYNPCEVFAKSLIFLSLQKHNNYPSQSLIEAMACGCSIIATDVGETRLLVKEEFGFLVQEDAQQIADKIFWLINNKQEAIKMGAHANNFVRSEHTIEKYGEYLLSIYKNVN